MGSYHVGDFVNRFRAGSLVMKLPDSEAAAIPTQLFGTIAGVIGLVASLPRHQFEFLTKLQARQSYAWACLSPTYSCHVALAANSCKRQRASGVGCFAVLTRAAVGGTDNAFSAGRPGCLTTHC